MPASSNLYEADHVKVGNFELSKGRL